MTMYYVNKNAQSNGDHEVHDSGCKYLPEKENRIYLGDYTYCSSAVTKVKEYYDQMNGCFFCSEACHTT